ncbi:SNF2 family N-terminal domain-containing protein [Mycotypha africana]|uniref:SNF2 family N-terminal domain-containing protein n=1 Tax=Mycotypha africana TaxID=64632 RepID=UPI002300FB57|nr:SNF2 family N-terminal domain-containing protein [Mycotypha africana]KAI8969095.1 SNF2 family N-terminal domain-containing protein [Mycotypha africana]
MASSDLLDLLTYVNRSTHPKRSLSPYDLRSFDRNESALIHSSLLDIFIHLPSPKIDKRTLQWCHNNDILSFLLEDITTQIPGMKTTLYNYQKNSLWKILQRELAPSLITPYQIVELRSADNTPYYYDQLTGTVTLQSTYRLPDAQGGIICEDMGTGKTCICLAAIMVTKDFSNPFQHDGKYLKTDFPSILTEANRPGGITSLKHTAALLILGSGINWKPVEQQLPQDIVDDWFKQYPIYYEWTNIPQHFDFERSRRFKPIFTTLKIYPATTTLVVVPDNLIAQWTGEVYKHIKDGHLKFIVYDDTKQTICSPFELIAYDLVLISQNRFSHEHSIGGLDFSSHLCRCSSIAFDKCECSVKRKKYVSPLLQVHWKRLIVDEGHTLSSKNRQAELSAKLFANWKWICTGTPTRNLTETASTQTTQDSESDDLNRLGLLIGQTLGIEPFKSNKKLWSRLISQPFLKRKPWAVNNLKQMLERIMIRNQRIDIEREVTLPPLHQKIVYLGFDYYQWIGHNCQIAMISLNAILSRREGADYLFSPKNHKALRETVHNLWQSCLWHSVEPNLIRSAYNNCIEKCTEIVEGRTDYNEKDNQDLFRIRDVLEHALNDDMFLCMMTHHSPSYVVQGLPALFKETWGWLNGDHGAYVPVGSFPWDDHCVINAERVVDVMDQVITAKANDSKNLFVYNGLSKTLISVEDDEETQDEQLTFYTLNAFSDARVLSSSSVKINYLVDQIYKYQKTEKCIIFSQHFNEMYEIYLALQLTRIRVLMYQESEMVMRIFRLECFYYDYTT